MDTLQQRIADTIRREVRHSAGIPERQEFRCDWLAIAAAVMCAVNARPHMTAHDSECESRHSICHHDGAAYCANCGGAIREMRQMS